jgi:hypothetical protein
VGFRSRGLERLTVHGERVRHAGNVHRKRKNWRVIPAAAKGR